jgi:isopenicillin N synthase-like dioxygenase
VNPVKERLSIAAFFTPDLDLDVGPLDELAKGSQKNYKTLIYRDFLRLLITSKLDGKGLLDRMKLED